MKWGNGFLVEILGLILCKSRVVKMKDRLQFCKKFRTLCIEDWVVVDPLLIFEREAALKDSDFW